MQIYLGILGEANVAVNDTYSADFLPNGDGKITVFSVIINKTGSVIYNRYFGPSLFPGLEKLTNEIKVAYDAIKN